MGDAALVAGKDLRIEWRSKVAIGQLIPFALLVLVLFAFALDPERGLLTRLAAGLFWVAVLFASTLAIARSFAIESSDGTADALRVSGLDPAGIFLGKAAAIAAQLAVLELVLTGGVVVLYNVDLAGGLLLAATCAGATVTLAATGTLYGAVAAGSRARDTLLPLLFLPVVAPVLVAATEACEAALEGAPADGWPWCGLLAMLAVLASAAGCALYGTLLEET